jgi:hypothetical protein
MLQQLLAAEGPPALITIDDVGVDRVQGPAPPGHVDGVHDVAGDVHGVRHQ